MTWPTWIKIPPPWFDEAAYLKANPGVAASPHFKKHPFEHWISSGYEQGFTWPKDPGKLKAKPGPTYPPDQPDSDRPSRSDKHRIWVDGFTGDEKTTEFIESKDNPQFKRFGAVAFGYLPGSSKRYVYNTKYIDHGRGHVEYHPGLTGKYSIRWYYRATGNRSLRPPDIRLIDWNGGVVEEIKGPVQYSESSAHRSFTFSFELSKDRYIAIIPGDPKSISFGRMEFERMT